MANNIENINIEQIKAPENLPTKEAKEALDKFKKEELISIEAWKNLVYYFPENEKNSKKASNILQKYLQTEIV